MNLHHPSKPRRLPLDTRVPRQLRPSMTALLEEGREIARLQSIVPVTRRESVHRHQRSRQIQKAMQLLDERWQTQPCQI